MAAGPVDVFWFQERWKLNITAEHSLREWLGSATAGGGKPHRALLWLAGASASWRIPEDWTHPDVIYEVALTAEQPLPSWLPAATRVHQIRGGAARDALRVALDAIDLAADLPLDYILVPGEAETLAQAARREAIPLISLPLP